MELDGFHFQRNHNSCNSYSINFSLDSSSRSGGTASHVILHCCLVSLEIKVPQKLWDVVHQLRFNLSYPYLYFLSVLWTSENQRFGSSHVMSPHTHIASETKSNKMGTLYRDHICVLSIFETLRCRMKKPGPGSWRCSSTCPVECFSVKDLCPLGFRSDDWMGVPV